MRQRSKSLSCIAYSNQTLPNIKHSKSERRRSVSSKQLIQCNYRYSPDEIARAVRLERQSQICRQKAMRMRKMNRKSKFRNETNRGIDCVSIKMRDSKLSSLNESPYVSMNAEWFKLRELSKPSIPWNFRCKKLKYYNHLASGKPVCALNVSENNMKMNKLFDNFKQAPTSVRTFFGSKYDSNTGYDPHYIDDKLSFERHIYI